LVVNLSLVALPANAVTIDPTTLGWDVQYMIDNSQMSQPSQPPDSYLQTTEPRNNRGLALYHDTAAQTTYLYAGYNSSHGSGEVRKIDTGVGDYTAATVAVLPGHRGKAIATDSQGRVYLGDGPQVAVYDANLTTQLATIGGFTAAEGVAVAQEGNELALYVTDRGNNTHTTTLSRFVVQGSGTGTSIGSLVDKTPSGANELRGIEVDPSGNVWAADFGGNAIYELITGTDGTNTFSGITTPMDIAFDDTHAFVTEYKNLHIAVLDLTNPATASSPLTPAWDMLALDSTGQSGDGALSGIDISSNGFLYIANEAGQTANGRSLWGAIDGASGIAGGVHYTDLNNDDNEPILVAGNAVITPNKLAAAQVPEPTSLLLVASTALLLIARRRRAGATAPFLESAV